VESRSDGLYWITPKVDKDSGEIINNETWLCSPLEVVGSGSDGAERYLVLRWRSPRGHEDITRAIPCADIGERDGWRSLKAGGVNVTTKSTFRAILADWLQQSGTDREWIITHTTGWHHGAYIMPDGEVIGDPETPILFNGRSAASSGYAIAGTAATWRDSVARLAGGNPSMMLGVAAALSAPLIGLVGADGFGVHLFEQSSAGKTTTANIASSLWGEPDALRLTWYGTALGIANEAEAHNDSLLPLDEVGQGSSAKDVATSAYTLFNGAGKLQGAKEGGNRELKRWRTVAISTGEMDIETFLAAGGLKVKAGQLVRLLNIPMEKSTAFNGLPNGKAHADALKEAWIDNHGRRGVSGLNGWQLTSRRLNRRCVTRKRAGAASSRRITVSRYTAWPNALQSSKPRW
jgi:putative DNA primase/helicase